MTQTLNQTHPDTADAEVIDCKFGGFSGSHHIWIYYRVFLKVAAFEQPLVARVTVENKGVILNSPFAAGKHKPYQKGDRIRIKYDKTNSKSFEIIDGTEKLVDIKCLGEYNHKKTVLGWWAALACIVGILIAGVFWSGIFPFLERRSFDAQVEGNVVTWAIYGSNSREVQNGKRYWATTEYEVGGETFTYKSKTAKKIWKDDIYWDAEQEKNVSGGKMIIFYDSKNPTKASHTKGFDDMTGLVGGGLLTALGLTAIVLMLTVYRPSKFKPRSA